MPLKFKIKKNDDCKIQPSASKNQIGYFIKGSKCGRDKDGTFYCECGKCEELSSEKSPQDAEEKDLSAGYLSEKERDSFICYIIARLESIEKWVKATALIIAIDLVISVIQILL